MGSGRRESRRERGLSAFGGEAPAPPPPPSPPTARPVRSVGEVVAAARRAIQGNDDLQGIRVRGEVSGFRAYASGHWYFTLKEEGAEIRCVMWRSLNARVRFEPEDGMGVVAEGGLDVYVARGEMQLAVTGLEPDGVGALAVALEQLKRKLAAEGLFDEARKRPLPPFPRVVGVVTSAQGAVWHDIQTVARRRFPGIHLVLRPVRVQGEGAAAEIAAAIRLFNAAAAADVLIVGRGGGSLEDLWAFNEEPVVRAIAASGIPVVSAVGHETDVTLADLVADVRAATPSQAAEIVVPEAEGVAGALDEAVMRLRLALARRVEVARARFDALARSPALLRPDAWLAERRQRADEARLRLEHATRLVLDARSAALRERAASLHALSPLAVLARGYAVARRPSDRRAVRSVDEAAPGDDVEIVVADGTIGAKVTTTRKEDRR